MIKGNKIYDLITGDYTGRWPQKFKPGKNGGSKPIIRPSGWNKAQVFPYELDKKKNVKEVETESGEIVNVLIPTSDIYNFDQSDVEDTPFGQIMDVIEKEFESNVDMVDKLKDEIAELEDELDEYRDDDKKEKFDSKSSGSGSSDRLKCTECGRVSDLVDWKANQRFCPHCNAVSIQQARNGGGF